MPEQNPLPLYEVLEEEYVSLHGPLPSSHYQKKPEERLKEIYKHIHALEKKRAAICISGGGIRSATFALGVMQRLARLELLKEFDYLSTVSGGGYVGSWLSAWIHRDPKGAGGVFSKLNNKPRSPLEPEAKPIQHLRSYSNYLSPKLGLLSADTWTLFAIITRNLILNWTVFFPLMLAMLIVPRLFTSFIRINLLEPTKDVVLTGLLLLALLLGVIAIAYMGVFRPSLKKFRKKEWGSFEEQGRFLKWCLAPTLGLVLLLCVYWAWLRNASEAIETQTSPMLGMHIKYPWAFFLVGVVLHLSAWVVQSVLLRRFKPWEFVVALVVGFAGGVFLWFAATQVFPQPTYDGDTWIPVTEYFVCFALPLLLIFMLLAVTLFVGFAKPLTDEDREWLARYGAWVLIAALGWTVISWLVVFGPHWLMEAHTSVKAAIAAAGGISGILVATLGRSASTAANEAQQAEGKQSRIKDIALKLAAPIFVLVFLVALSLATSELLVFLKSHLGVGWHVAPLPDSLGGEMGHLKVIHNSSIRVLLLVFAVFLAIGFLMSVVININAFSLHSMYRNRLIRAYLGASREKRYPNPFTGFDPYDDIQMHELRPALFHEGSFTDPSGFLNKIKESSDPVSQYLQPEITKTRDYLKDPEHPGSASPLAMLIRALNEVVEDKEFYAKERFTNVTLSEDTNKMLESNPTGNNRVVLNRLLLQDAYPGEINDFRSRKPFHVVNMALNLVHGDNLAWQERKAESFTASPLHCGSYTIKDEETGLCGSYRTAKEYGEGISLGTAVAISGAAVSPNMGYHSSAVITFLLTLFNARLGWWLGNPGKPGSDTYYRSGPFLSIRPLLAEAFGLTDDKNKYIYLSDGGHFENLAFYEMVLRRCHSIVVSDGGADPECAFDDLGGAIRKIRIDLGVRITIDKIMIFSRKSDDKQKKYCAVGTIHYSEVDGGGEENDGTLVYIKPAICGGEPADVFNYAQTSKTFPHETTADQFFSESQFESYRALGDHAVQQMSDGWKQTGGLAGWADHIKTGYLQLLPRKTEE